MPARPILIADDEPGMRNALFEALTRQGPRRGPWPKTVSRPWKNFQAQPLRPGGDRRAHAPHGRHAVAPGDQEAVAPGCRWWWSRVTAPWRTRSRPCARGAFDYVLKPFFPLELIEEIVVQALGQSQNGAGPARGRARGNTAAGPSSPRTPPLKRPAADGPFGGALPRATVLIGGESGTGKELLARFIHHHSDRGHGAFVAVNPAPACPRACSRANSSATKKGSFTGAVARKTGKFELADGGTILLDEISEMDLSLQAKLLRVLQEGEIDRVGGKGPIKINVRVVATTNRQLRAWVHEGRFREDLYYRLNVIPLTIPPLRERPGDIPILANHFLDKYAQANNQPFKPLTERALGKLRSLAWPGNVPGNSRTSSRGGVLLAQDGQVDLPDLFLEETEAVEARAGRAVPPRADGPSGRWSGA